MSDPLSASPIPGPRPTGLLRGLCGLLVALAGAGAVWSLSRLTAFAEIFDTMVEGGVSALPTAARLVIEGRETLTGLAAVVLLMACVMIWRSRRDQPVLITTVAATIFFGALAVVPTFVIQSALQTVIQKFRADSP